MDPVPADAASAAVPAPKAKTPLWKRALRSLVLIIVGTYVAFCVALYFAQDSMIFPAKDYPATPEPRLSPQVQILHRELSAPDVKFAKSVEAWYVPAPGASKDTPAPLIVFFHGNGEFIDHHLGSADAFNKLGWSVLMPEYRGYNRSAGTPSQATILEDAAYFLKETLARPEVDAARVVYYGRSLGGGAACDLTHAHTPQGIILNCTFLSMNAMARQVYAPSVIVKHPFRNDLVIESFNGPTLIAHGSQDTMIPPSNSQALAKLAKHGTYLELKCGHNDFPGSPDTAYWSAVKNFLDAIPAVK